MKKILLLLLLLPFFSFGQALSGSYIIKSSNAAPFNTLVNAVVRINTFGVSGPVTFLLDEDQNVTSQITINQFAGSSTTNTLTIKPNVGKAVTITAKNINSYTNTSAVIQLNGADNIIIDGSNNGSSSRNLIITNTSTLNYNELKITSAILWIASTGDGSNMNKIKNINFIGLNVDFTTSTSAGIIFSNNTDMNTEESVSNSSNEITNNVFTKMKTGISILGGSSYNSNILINKNEFGSSDLQNILVYSALKLSNIQNAIVKDNKIIGVNLPSNSVTVYGIYLYNRNLNSSISSNKISNITNTEKGIARGIEIEIDDSIDSNLLICNNMINNVTTINPGQMWETGNAGHGIYIRKGKKINIYYNTVIVDKDQDVSSSALFIQNGSFLDVRNNIFANIQSKGRRFAIYSKVDASAFSNIDYNDYYVKNMSIGYIGYLGGDKSTLADWKSVTTKDTHSINFNPTFISETDLHLKNDENPALKSATPITGITTDIDGDKRAAIPYMGADEIKCALLVTWNGVSWLPGAPTIDSKVVFVENYNEDEKKLDENKDIEACSCEVTSNFKVVFKTGNTLKVMNEVQVATTASLTFENNASLVQVNDVAANSGVIVYKRITTPVNRYDYTYWSSPVEGMTLYKLSPHTFFDKYYSYSNNWVVSKDGVAPMIAGNGYIIRAPQSTAISGNPLPFAGEFNGEPNNGNITVPLKGHETYLLGNPYPSAINADAFLTENKEKLEGTLYFWTHNTAPKILNPGDKTYKYIANDYASYNRTGGVGTITSKAAVSSGISNFLPDGNIAAGQGFFAPVIKLATGNVVFNNSMRLSSGGSVLSNSQFFKLSTSSKTTTVANATEKSRIWLNLSNKEGAFKQTLIGYISGATNDYDGGFDGVSYNGNQYLDFYSVNQDKNLTIQGRALPFVQKDSVALGYKSTIRGEFEISIDQTDGALATQNVFLEDKDLKVLHDLKKESYVFITEIGIFNTRFVLRYVDKNAVEIQLPETPEVLNKDILVSVKEGAIKIDSPLVAIDKVSIYDNIGRMMFQKEAISNTIFVIPHLISSHQMLVVSILLSDGTKVSRKIMY